MGPLRGAQCERARQWASLRSDGELSELEGALLERHLERCPSCHAFVDEVAALTLALRALPPALPGSPVALPLGRRYEPLSFFRTGIAVAAAAVVMAVGLSGLVESSGSHEFFRSAAPMSSESEELQLQRARRSGIVEETQTSRRPGGFGAQPD